MTAYPNPTTESLTIETISTLSVQDQPPLVELASLVDNLGLSLAEGNIVDGKMIVNVKGTKKGLYYLKVKIEDKIYTEQILIE